MIRLNRLKKEFTTYSNTGILITTLKETISKVWQLPDQDGFERIQSIYFSIEHEKYSISRITNI
ncbi:MAG: hypothetical protein EA391_12870 [Balneolaceae bacterium]|nr:MAG: hypothetical protein EA391_12870 [Balneolaceae bacterium]